MDAGNYLKALIRKKWLLMGLTFLLTIGSYLLTSTIVKTSYSAEVTLYVTTVSDSLSPDLPTTEQLQLGRTLMEEYADLATSRRILSRALLILTEASSHDLEAEAALAKRIRMEVSPVSGIATLSVSAPSAEQAALSANVIADLFVEELSRITGNGHIRILDEAIPPVFPDSKHAARNAILGGMLGFACGIVTVYLLQWLHLQKTHDGESAPGFTHDPTTERNPASDKVAVAHE